MKTWLCADAGFGCQGVISGTTVEEVLTEAARHACKVHR
ncbi:MAG: DUF1059 domain-containing protein [Bacteroidota bacterium]|nr:DUF1059 domain-containing protein [Bacteroidota bacterium]